MRKIALILIAASLASLAGAQTKTGNCLNEIPVLPQDSCNISRDGAGNFAQQVDHFIDQVDNEINMRNNQVNAHAKVNEDAAKEAALKQMSQQYGMSGEDLNKLKNAKNLSSVEKQALANKMMMQQTNISMDEARNLQKMSESGRKAYAEAYGAEAMANSKNNPRPQSGSGNASNMNQLLSAQQDIMGKIMANSQKIGNQYAAIENDPSGQEMLKKIETWHNKLMSMTGVDYGQGKKMDSLSLLIKNEQIKYCNKFTPKYRAALRLHLAILKSSLPDYQRLGEVTSELTKAQAGIAIPPESKEIGSLEALKEYLGKLKDAYKFKLYYPEVN